MILDKDIQMSTNWKTHVQTDGSNIGGVPPVNYGLMQGIPGIPTATLFYTSGSTVKGGYADWEAYSSRYVLPNTGNLQLSLDLTVDGKAATAAQCIEIDTILCIGGLKYNFSFQINYAQMVLQIDPSSKGWQTAATLPAKLSPNVAHTLVLTYAFDTVKKTTSFQSIAIDGAIYAVSAALQNIPAQATTWSDCAMLQVQQDLNAQAGQFSMLIDNAQYAWW